MSDLNNVPLVDLASLFASKTKERPMNHEVFNKTKREFLASSRLAFLCAVIGVPAMTSATAVAADYKA
jgi:hypothetical protein